MEEKLCPLCKTVIKGYPAISRKDNKTEICSSCGVIEALEIFVEAQRKEIIINDGRTNKKHK